MDRDVRRYRAFLGLTVWLLLLLSARASRAADTPAPASTGFEVVTVDLNAQTFDRVLPFDVPFIITGAVPQGIASLEVRCWVLKVDQRRKPILVTEDDLSRHRVNPDGDCWDGKPLVWRNTIDPSIANPMFRVLAPRLEAENSYQFKFSFEKQVTPKEAQAFAQMVQGIADSVLWGNSINSSDPPLSGDLTEAEVKDIRNQLIQALKQVTGADQIQAPGTIFDEKAPPEAVREVVRKEFNRLLLPVRNAQSQIHSTADNYRNTIEDLNNPQLRKLRDDPLLQSLREGLAARGAADPSAQDRAADVTAASAVADAPVLRSADLQSAAALSAFVQNSQSYFIDASAKVGKLRAFLAGRLIEDNSPKAMLAPLVQAGKLSPNDLRSLAAMAEDQGTVGKVDRALAAGESLLANFQSSLDIRAQAVVKAAEEYRTQARRIIVVAGSTTGSFQTQSNNYISADTGVACAPELTTCSTYAGTNIYFRPVNKAAPLSQFGSFFSRPSFSRRASITLGLTVNGIGDGGKTREDLIGSQTLVYGFGVRMTNSVRFTAGGLLFKKLSPNPLSTDKKLATTYFVSISFDIDVAPALNGIGNLFRP